MKKVVTTLFIYYLLLSFCLTQSNDSSTKKIGLVLSGGGIKGFGHIGTLQLIDSLNIPIDFIAGSSIGAITAALYATGHSAEEIKKIAYNTKWDEIFSQARKRNQLYYFQKKDANKYQLSFSLDGLKPTAPISLTSGQFSYEHLLDIFPGYQDSKNYDQLIIPFRCNATDLITGEEIVFSKGSLANSLRVSSSIPTVFSPLEYANTLVVDGGLINNIPTDIVKKMGADYIIAVDVSTTIKNKGDIITVFDIVQQIINLHGYNNERKNIPNSDLLIYPDLKDFNITNSDPQTLDLITKEGKKAAYKHIDAFLNLKQETEFIKFGAIKTRTISLQKIVLNDVIKNDSIINNLFIKNSNVTKDDFLKKISTLRKSDKYYNVNYLFKKTEKPDTYDLHLNAKINQPILIDNILVKGNKKINSHEILKMFSIKKGDILNIKQFNQEILKAYRTDYFYYINYNLIKNEPNKSTLVINVKEDSPKKLKLGIIWDNHYKLIGKLKLDLLNKPVKNFRIQDELLFSGIKRNALMINYLLTKNNKINLIPFIQLTNQIKKIKFTEDNIDITHELHSLSYGIIFPILKYGSINTGFNKEKNIYKTINTKKNIDYINIDLDLDQLDNLLHPRNGYKVFINYNFNRFSLEEKYTYINAKAEYYNTFNYNHTIRLYHWYKHTSQNAPLHLRANYAGYNWLIGYDEYTISSLDLISSGFEYQYHYKNSTTLRLIINKIFKVDTIKNYPLTYGVGLRIRSIVGPLNFIWGRGYTDPLNKESKKTNILYFNFGVEL